MRDGRLNRLALELHASAANQAALESGGYYLPIDVIRRTLELMASVGLLNPPPSPAQADRLESRRVLISEYRPRR